MPQAAVPIATTVASSVINKKSTDKAAKAQQQSADQAIQIQKEMYDQSRADLAPYRNTGYAANKLLSKYMGLGEFDRESIGNDLKKRFKTLNFAGAQPANSFGGTGMAATPDGREALGRMYMQEQAGRPGAFQQGYSDTIINQMTPEDFATVGEYASLSPTDRQYQRETNGTTAVKLSEILNKYRRSA